MKEVGLLMELGEQMERKPGASMKMAEALLWVRGRDGGLQKLAANAAQQEFERRRGQRNIVLKARQMGMTTWVAGRFFLRTITQPGTLTALVAQSQDAAEAIFRTVQRMWANLPADLREGPLWCSRANAGQMVFGGIDSEFRVWSAGDANAGRGVSIQNLHCSEVSRWPGDAAATLAGLRAALTPDGEMVLESTPNGAYGAFYEEWLGGVDVADGRLRRNSAGAAGELRFPTHDDETVMNGPPGHCRRNSVGAAGELRFPTHDDETVMNGPPGHCGPPGLVRHFLPWWMEPAYVGAAVSVRDMSEAELELVGRHGLSAEQIGFRRGLERSYGMMRSQEFAEDAETCFRATGACCFEVDAIERRLAEAPEPLEFRRGGSLLVWLPPMPGKDYLVAVDTAGGGEDGDFAAVQVVERASGLQCAELQERLRPAELAQVAAALAREYGGAMVAVERNNHGAAVIAYLETSERYSRLYGERGEKGWLTTSASKPEMVAWMGVLLRESAEMFQSRRLLAECRTFVAGERGRTGAASGSHDDLVMAMAVAQAVRVKQGIGNRE